MFPDADTLLKYLDDFRTKLGLSVQFNTNIENIDKIPDDTVYEGHSYLLKDQHSNLYKCS